MLDMIGMGWVDGYVNEIDRKTKQTNVSLNLKLYLAVFHCTVIVFLAVLQG